MVVVVVAVWPQHSHHPLTSCSMVLLPNVDWSRLRAIGLLTVVTWKTRVVIGSLGIGLTVAGSLLWVTRSSFVSSAAIERRFGSEIKKIPEGTTANLNKECKELTHGNGWLLFLLDTHLTFDDQSRSYFETSDSPNGLRLESTPGSLVLRREAESSDITTAIELHVRTIRRDEKLRVIVGLSSGGVRIVTNSVDKQLKFNSAVVPEYECNAVRVVEAEDDPSARLSCEGCNSSLKYVFGTDSQRLAGFLDEVSNVKSFNLRRWAGSGAFLSGLLLLFRSVQFTLEKKSDAKLMVERS